VIREVGLRDGLQSIARTLPTAQKKQWLRGAHAAGQREIEVGSFVPAGCCRNWPTRPSWWRLPRRCRACLSRCWCPTCAAPSARIESGADLMLVPLSASHAHSLANLRKTPTRWWPRSPASAPRATPPARKR
jgi:hydroxymethylglutaryl-CoA lyase